jgi:glycosyl hydrolase family 9/cellulase-like Ig domain-containing protein
MRALVLAAAVAAIACAAPAAVSARTPAAAVRVDQLGFAPTEAKIAYLLTATPRPGAPFSVVDAAGTVVLTGAAGPSRGRWNSRYRAVQPLDLSALTAPGTYRIELAGPPAATSPPFRIDSPAALFAPRVADVVSFFQAQRDGKDVIAGPLHRKPSHLNDRKLRWYAPPSFQSTDSDVITDPALRPLGGFTNLEGGWLDAGDFVKFTHTIAYADTLLFASERALAGAAPPTLDAEARFGLRFLRRAWSPGPRVLALQVGIGSGNAAGSFYGDHDVWRLPERDDHLAGARNRYLKRRPAFRANAPGTPLPPNLAGRVSAAFALAAQLDARGGNAGRAHDELDLAAQVFAAARADNVKPTDVVTALPHAFYPERAWRDDMELGAAELSLAGLALHDARTGAWLKAGKIWGREYLANEAGGGTLNLYDVSALAHADLVLALRTARSGTSLQGRLLADLRAQVARGAARSARDPFAAGAIYDDFDAVPHAFGLVSSALLYRSLTGDRAFDAFATAQRDWALGANAWGESFMIGVGEDFPHCPQHVVANLSGRRDGRPPVLLGAVVNGPNDARLFTGGLDDFFANGHACPPTGGDALAAFTGHGSRFVDDVSAWQTVEPAIDFDAAAALAFALSAVTP